MLRLTRGVVGGAGERVRERRLKEKILEILEKEADPRLAAEWLWEEFGKRVQPTWPRIRRAILGDKDITPQDLVSLLDELGVPLTRLESLDDDPPEQVDLDACIAAKTIVKVASPGKGGSPGFKEYHVVEALRASRRRALGRPAAQRLLRLGEASAKTLLHRLKAEGLAEHADRGVKASTLGEALLSAVEKALGYGNLRADIPGLWDEDAAVAYIKCAKPPTSLTDVYRVRDYLVEEGCKTAVIGGGAEGSYRFPGVPEEIERSISTVLEGSGARGLIVVVPAHCLETAVSALVRLLAEECPC